MKYVNSLLFAILLSITPLTAQIDRSKAPEPGPAPVITVGDYHTFELKNGLKVFVVENHKIPRVAYSLVMDIDPFTEGDSTGYTSIAGQLLGTATVTRTKDQIDEEIDFIGASLSTTSGSMYGAALKKHNDKLLELMSDILLNPVFNQEELEKIKKQTISAIAFNKTDPSSISDVVGDVLNFSKDHPYGEVATEASVESITTGMCEEYYSTYFRPNIAYLAIVGDINLREAKKISKKYFGEWEAADVPGYTYNRPSAPGERQVSIVDRSHAVQSVIKVTHPVVFMVGMEDYIEARVMNLILGGTFARLDQNLREDHAYTYGVSSSLSQDKYIGHFTVGTDVRNEVTDSAVYQILYEIDRIRNEPAPGEEVDKIKNYLSGNFALALERPNTVARFALNIARYGLPEDYYVNYLRYITEVTPEDVQAAARKYLKPGNCHILVVGKASEIAGKLAAFSPTKTVNYYDVEGNRIDPASMVMPIPEGMTADRVIEKYLEAIGGREKLESIQDLSIDMVMEMQGMELQSQLLKKSPDKFLMSMKVGETIVSRTVFDGTSGKVTGMQGEQVPSGEELEKLRIQSQFMPELEYEELGYQLRLLSIVKVDNRDAYKLEITDHLGDVSTQYFDADTFLKIKQESIQDTPQGPVTQTVSYSDYRNVEGYMSPYKMIFRFGPQVLNGTVQKVEVNKGIDDSVFR
jgi:predicted Zn-dependent peptidase